MNITERTCANCATFNPAPETDEPTCWNLVSITEQYGTPQALSREPGQDDCCSNHQTHEEDQAAADAIRAAGHPLAFSNPPALDAAL